MGSNSFMNQKRCPHCDKMVDTDIFNTGRRTMKLTWEVHKEDGSRKEYEMFVDPGTFARIPYDAVTVKLFMIRSGIYMEKELVKHIWEY